jgi:hypothetical protein
MVAGHIKPSRTNQDNIPTTSSIMEAKTMTHYTLINEKDTEELDKEFANDIEAKEFVVSHLDLSKNWHILKIKRGE